MVLMYLIGIKKIKHHHSHEFILIRFYHIPLRAMPESQKARKTLGYTIPNYLREEGVQTVHFLSLLHKGIILCHSFQCQLFHQVDFIWFPQMFLLLKKLKISRTSKSYTNATYSETFN